MTSVADIVIVNWNTGPLLAECLASIAERSSGVGRVVVVDNGSSDGSFDVSAPTLDLRLIRRERNEGFARACNIGAGETTAPYILFLNPDTRFLEDQGLARLVGFLESDAGADIGVAGIRLVDERGQTQPSCANFTNARTFLGQPFGLDRVLPAHFTPLFADFDYTDSRDVDQVIGAYFLVRRSVYEELQGFDERFFVYWEEVDFCLRAKRLGWRAHHFAGSVAYHKGGGSSGRVKARRLFYQLRSRTLYSFKHFGSAEAWMVLLSTALVEPISRLARSLLRGSLSELGETVDGYGMFLRELPAILRAHRRLDGKAQDDQRPQGAR